MKGKYEAPVQKKNSKKGVVLLLVLFLLVGCVIGTTLAWLIDETGPITNTFTVGDITISLDETTSDYKMVPGREIAKNPAVKVTKGSEDCYVYIEITESDDEELIAWTIASGWNQLEGSSTIWYQSVESLEAADDVNLAVLKDNKVIVSEDLTDEQADLIKAGTMDKPTLTFKAYAVQKEGFDTAKAAWDETFGATP